MGAKECRKALSNRADFLDAFKAKRSSDCVFHRADGYQSARAMMSPVRTRTTRPAFQVR